MNFDKVKLLFEANLLLAQDVYVFLKKQGKTVSTAESCTGGMLSMYFTEIPGSSEVYEGGFTCYSNRSKIEHVKVSEKVLEKEGAVSEKVAHDLAKNVRELFSSDFGISITGIAGPGGGTYGKPVGTVWCGLANKHQVRTWCLNVSGERSEIRQKTVKAVMTELLKFMERAV